MLLIDKLHDMARRLRNLHARRGLSPLSRSVLKDSLTYLSPAKLSRIEEALESVQGIEGDFLNLELPLADPRFL